MRAIIIFRGHLPAATGTGPEWLLLEGGREGAAGFRENPAAPVTFQERLPTLDRDKGNEKKTQVVIQPLKPRCRRATGRAGPRLVIDLHLLGLHTPDEKEEDTPPLEPAGAPGSRN